MIDSRQLIEDHYVIKKIEEWTISDVYQLIEDAVIENKYIEYKSVLPKNDKDGTRKFLAVVSSFANSNGGLIIYGINAKDGIPLEIKDIGNEQEDTLKLKYGKKILDTIEPRINVEIRVIGNQGERVMLVQISNSFSKPHRVIFGGWDKFFARNSAGKYPMNVGELRSMFISGNESKQKIEAFIENRKRKILNNDTYLTIYDYGILIMHIIPINNFIHEEQIDINGAIKNSINNKMIPISSSGFYSIMNFDGYLTYDRIPQEDISHSYIQLFRNGSIEFVNNSIFYDNTISIDDLEISIMNSIYNSLEIFNFFSINGPYILNFSINNIRDHNIYTSQRRKSFKQSAKIDNFIYPSQIFNSDTKIIKLCKPLFDMLWNAYDINHSINYSDTGSYIGKSYSQHILFDTENSESS